MFKHNFEEVKRGLFVYQLGKTQEKRKTVNGKIEIYKPGKKG